QAACDQRQDNDQEKPEPRQECRRDAQDEAHACRDQVIGLCGREKHILLLVDALSAAIAHWRPHDTLGTHITPALVTAQRRLNVRVNGAVCAPFSFNRWCYRFSSVVCSVVSSGFKHSRHAYCYSQELRGF